jgi:hypothetical protein
MLLLWNVWKDFFPPDRIGGSYLANLLLGVAIVLLLGYLVTFPERLVRRWRADRFADSPNSASVGQVVDDIES